MKRYGKAAECAAIESERCSVHDDQRHGREAEELRRGIEKILERDYDGRRPSWRRDLQALLDRTDARDSLAYLERKPRRVAHTKGPEHGR